MTIYFSAGTRGFYDSNVHAGRVPSDAVRISPKQHRALVEGQAAGHQIVAGPDGRPKLAAPPPETVDQQRARIIRRVKREAARRIEVISPAWRQLNDLREPSLAGAARFARIDAIRAASALIEAGIGKASPSALATFPIADNSHWPELLP